MVTFVCFVFENPGCTWGTAFRLIYNLFVRASKMLAKENNKRSNGIYIFSPAMTFVFISKANILLTMSSFDKKM